MKNNLFFALFATFFSFLQLAGASQIAAGDLIPGQKLRLVFSGNVQAELGPCG